MLAIGTNDLDVEQQKTNSTILDNENDDDSLARQLKLNPKCKSRLEHLVWNIIVRFTELARSALAEREPNGSMTAYTSRLVVQDLIKLIELNLAATSRFIIRHRCRRPSLFCDQQQQQKEQMIEDSSKYFRPITIDQLDCEDEDDEDDDECGSKLDYTKTRVAKLPGIGPVLAGRLEANSISTLGDLRELFEGKCARSESRFEFELKHLVGMRAHTIRKCLDAARNCTSS